MIISMRRDSQLFIKVGLGRPVVTESHGFQSLPHIQKPNCRTWGCFLLKSLYRLVVLRLQCLQSAVADGKCHMPGIFCSFESWHDLWEFWLKGLTSPKKNRSILGREGGVGAELSMVSGKKYANLAYGGCVFLISGARLIWQRPGAYFYLDSVA